MDRKVTRSEHTMGPDTRKLTYKSPSVRRVRLDAAGSVLTCGKRDLDTCIPPGILFS